MQYEYNFQQKKVTINKKNKKNNVFRFVIS